MGHLLDGTLGCSMGGLGRAGGRERMWLRHIGVDVEGGDIAGDKVEGRLGFLWDVDAQVKRSLQEVLVDLILGLMESEDHHAIGFILILILLWCLYVR